MTKNPGLLRDYFLDEVEIRHCPRGPEYGEDFLYSDFGRPTLHLQAVFDGCGGAGGWTYREFQNHTGAYIAARSLAGTRAGVGNWFAAQSTATCADEQALARSYQAHARDWLLTLKESCAPMALTGSLVKSFPSTADIALMQLTADLEIDLTVLHCGDSRVYALTPGQGLVQLTDDDSRGHPDPLTSLRLSAPLSDMLNADKPFRIKPVRTRLPMPCAVLCATDGVFGYVRSPMDFEHLLLETLAQSDGPDGFARALETAVTAVTGDDAALVLSFYGPDAPREAADRSTRRRLLAERGVWAALQRQMEPRRRLVDGLIRTIDGAPDAEEALQRIWADYRRETIFSERQG